MKMKATKTYPYRCYNHYAIQFFRVFIKPLLPPSWFRESIPEQSRRKVVNGHVKLEIVSHCWNYANTLTYQLSSFVNYPPTKADVTVTVFYSKEDKKTQDVIDFFNAIEVQNVTWNFHALSKEKLFRRGIGRNMAARSTQSDWVWFTDCDIIFHQNCLDSLADELQGKQDILYYPRTECTTEMLRDDDPMLRKDSEPQVVDIPITHFEQYSRKKAKGAFQIVNADVVRAIGYCEKLKMFQREDIHWRKTYEDSAFKWLINRTGIPLEIEGVYQIRHVTKGRYMKGSSLSKVRSKIRHMQEND